MYLHKFEMERQARLSNISRADAYCAPEAAFETDLAPAAI
jgi:hypothetical protein